MNQTYHRLASRQERPHVDIGHFRCCGVTLPTLHFREGSAGPRPDREIQDDDHDENRDIAEERSLFARGLLGLELAAVVHCVAVAMNI